MLPIGVPNVLPLTLALPCLVLPHPAALLPIGSHYILLIVAFRAVQGR